MLKRLGQYILINRGVVKKIIESLDLQTGDTVIEVGPGTGVLTQELIKLPIKIIAIEKDPEMIRRLNSRLKITSSMNIQITQGDALKILPSLISETKISDYKIVGNIPYYITGRILRILSEIDPKPQLITLTIQREVAERMISKPPKMNLLAAITQFWAEIQVIAYLNPTDFNPTPKVNSAIISLKSHINPNLSSSQGDRLRDKYFKFVKILFRQPRKTILNNLVSGLDTPKNTIDSILKSIRLTGKERPQNLDLRQIINLCQLT